MRNDIGHVFVIKGDINHLACDVYLHSTDRELRPSGGWLKAIPDAATRLDPVERAAFQAEEVFAVEVRVADIRSPEPTPVLTAVPYVGVSRADQVRERVQHFFRTADAVVRRQAAADRPLHRERALVALPLFGSRRGSGGPVRGDILRVLYDEARSAARTYGFDVVVVLADPRAYDLAQVIRRNADDGWPDLGADEVAAAAELAEDARRGRLVPFMGSGTSVSAGAPTWRALIDSLARNAGLSEELAKRLSDSHDVLDQAQYLDREFSRTHPENPSAFAEAIIAAVNVRRYGLAPAMLASLTAEQAITLNYDELFEIAARDAGLERRVIPGDTAEGDRWLLKLHGTVSRPESIVLTRDHYLRFSSDRDSLTSLAKATLMTRRLLFVGFGMSDSHFHEIAHDVRRAQPPQRDRAATFGTVLTVDDMDITRRLWEGDLDFISFGGSPRRLDIFLDAVMAQACDGHSYTLAAGYASTLPPEDASLRDAVTRMIDSLEDTAAHSAAWPLLETALRELGWSGALDGRSRSAARSAL